jgi:RHS repeat-associated protein
VASDEAGVAHTYCPDGLERQASVTDGGGTNIYTYDALDNLIGVQAVGQTNNTCTSGGIGQMRCFAYSSLSRLGSATNPESGTTNYVYDNNGNMISRTDAVGNITAVSYDAMSRPQGAAGAPAVGYATTGSTQPTAAICYVWDLDFKGALRSVSTSSSNTSCATAVTSDSYTHDQLGRIESSQQFTLGQWYQFRYGYSLENRLNYEKYPSGRQVKYTLDTAGRVNAVQNGTTLANYASGVSYVAAGGLNGLTLGNGVTHQWSWNDRFQPVGMTAKNASLTTLLGLGFYPCAGLATACATGNNGNLQAQTISGPGLSLTQSYTYDPGVNRLTGINENGPALENYGYDGNGNRWVSYHSLGLVSLTNETPQSANWFSPANRITGSIYAWSYDQNGNVLQVGGMTRFFGYDAENRQVQATINGTSAGYAYDGLGQRVTKTVNGQTTVYVYDAFGNVAAEYGQPETPACGTTPCYVTWDQLGSTRMVTDSSGNAPRRYDYLPFGQEIPFGVDGLGAGYLSSADDYNPKFTGQMRDQETALDWFNARHMSGAQGRFQSVDPGNAGADPSDPQSWNMYSYVGNNPLSYTDPSGMNWFRDAFSWGWDAFKEGLTVFANVLTLGHFGGLWGTGIDLGSLTHCGGPLGNCGAVGGDTWSEDPGLGGVQDPGRFVLNLSPLEHIALTMESGGSLGFGLGVAGVDFWPGSQGTNAFYANWHATGGLVPLKTLRSWRKPAYVVENCGAAYAGTVQQLASDTALAQAGNSSATMRALHTIQDSYAAGHGYQTWTGWVSWAHFRGDWFPSADVKRAAVDATSRYLGALGGRGAMGTPESYLAPRPAGCR